MWPVWTDETLRLLSAALEHHQQHQSGGEQHERAGRDDGDAVTPDADERADRHDQHGDVPQEELGVGPRVAPDFGKGAQHGAEQDARHAAGEPLSTCSDVYCVAPAMPIHRPWIMATTSQINPT